MIKIHPSSLGLIMADAQSIDKSLLSKDLLEISGKKKKTDEDKEFLAPYLTKTLSAGAKTYIKKLAKEFVYGFTEQISNKYLDKGIKVENDSIELYNRVFKTKYEKNTERKTNQWLTGECDVFTGTKIIEGEQGTEVMNAQKNFVTRLCAIAKELNVHIHFVHHTKKPDNENKPASRYDAKGSGSISDNIHNSIIVWSNKDKENTGVPDTVLICDKQRNGEWEGQIPLWFRNDCISFVSNPMDEAFKWI